MGGVFNRVLCRCVSVRYCASLAVVHGRAHAGPCHILHPLSIKHKGHLIRFVFSVKNRKVPALCTLSGPAKEPADATSAFMRAPSGQAGMGGLSKQQAQWGELRPIVQPWRGHASVSSSEALNGFACGSSTNKHSQKPPVLDGRVENPFTDSAILFSDHRSSIKSTKAPDFRCAYRAYGMIFEKP